MNRLMLSALLGALAVSATAMERPRWHAQIAPTAAQLRDVSVVDARVAWVAGDDGVVLRTTDGGRNWKSVSVPDGDAAFRDIEAFSLRSAIVFAAGEGSASRIYRTDDAGKTWNLSYEGRTSRPALACMGFWNPEQGVLVSDARDGRFELRVTTDGGRNWRPLAGTELPSAQVGERVMGEGQNCLAATGNGRIAFAAGSGARARLVASDDNGAVWRSVELPHLALLSPASVGLMLKGGHAGYAARGVSDKEVAHQTAQLQGSGAVDSTALRRDGRVQWISVGSDGSRVVDRSGQRSTRFAPDAFSAVDGSANGALVLAVGSDGRIAQLRW